MDFDQGIMIAGFLLASYSVVGNDVIQTLGTFISSNDRRPWWVLFAFAAIILSATLIYGYVNNAGDISYGRLNKIPYPETIHWWYAFAPLVLMLITRVGIPVSTTFLILSVFAGDKTIGAMVGKSLIGYAVAIGVGLVVYISVLRLTERIFIRTPENENDWRWLAAQWLSTGFLWSQWLIQDLANIFVYLPRGTELSPVAFGLALLTMVGLLAYIFSQKGGAIQKIVQSKTNTQDIRSATFIDLIFAFILLFFKELNDVPMSTTWVFIGLLAGREFGMNLLDKHRSLRGIVRITLSDLGKTFAGLAVSVIVVYTIRFLGGA